MISPAFAGVAGAVAVVAVGEAFLAALRAADTKREERELHAGHEATAPEENVTFFQSRTPWRRPS